MYGEVSRRKKGKIPNQIHIREFKYYDTELIVPPCPPQKKKGAMPINIVIENQRSMVDTTTKK